LLVVCGAHNGVAGCGRRAKKSEDGRRVIGVEVAGGFVRQEQRWPVNGGPSQSYSLLFTAREFGWQVICASCEADARELRVGQLPPRVLGAALSNQWQSNILPGSKMRDKVEGLEEKSDCSTAIGR
jgi:hypothetical protein